MTEILGYPFFVRAIAAGVMVSLLCGIISVFVVLRRMAFIGAGISHAAFGGVALGFLFGISPAVSGGVYATATAFFIHEVVRRKRISEDTAIGIFFSASMALGVICMGLAKNSSIDLFGYLFGNILAVEPDELMPMALVCGGILAVLLFNFKKLYILTFNEELAYVGGIDTGRLTLFLLVVMAIVIVLFMKVVGLILVSALLVIPAAVARSLTLNIAAMTVISAGIALAGTVSGLFLSVWFDLPSGGTIVLVLSALFFLSAVRSK